MSTFGNDCIDRPSSLWTENYTVMDIYNPASNVGTLTQGCVYLNSATGTGKIKVFRVNGSNYDLVGQSGAQALSVGANTFSGLSISILPGDLIGFYGSTWGISLDTTQTTINLKSHSGEVTGTTAISSWYDEYNIGSILATYTIIEYNDIYVNSSTGNDSYAGDSCVAGHPKLTFAAAYALLASGGTLHVCNNLADFSAETVTLNKSFNIDLNGADGYFYMPKAS